jgi:hypothetical protein
MMPSDIPFKCTGTVSQRYALQGSFCNVRLSYGEGADDTVHTVGIDECLKFPAVGERIRVTGTIRNGRHLTKFWERA